MNRCDYEQKGKTSVHTENHVLNISLAFPKVVVGR